MSAYFIKSSFVYSNEIRYKQNSAIVIGSKSSAAVKKKKII